MVFTNDSAMPETYANGAFVGNRGSWNRNQFNGYKMIYVPFADGNPSGMAVDVVTGFLDGDKARGRPVGLGIDGTGALLIADDAGNTVWRVAPADGTVVPEPIPSDRITPPLTTPELTQEVDASPGLEPNTSEPPPQTDIAPAVGPEDGAEES